MKRDWFKWGVMGMNGGGIGMTEDEWGGMGRNENKWGRDRDECGGFGMNGEGLV